MVAYCQGLDRIPHEWEDPLMYQLESMMATKNVTMVNSKFLDDGSADNYDWSENAWLRGVGSDPVEYDPESSGSIITL